MRKKGIKFIGYFFTIMLALTLISRMVNATLTPKVKIQKVSEQVITHESTSEGVVTYKRQVSMTSLPDLFVDTLEVTEGQKVEHDQLLYTLNLTKISEKIQALEREIEKLALQNEQYLSEINTEYDKKQRNIQRATEAHNEAISFGDQQVAKAAKELEIAINELKQLDTTKENDEENRKQLETIVAEKQKIYDEAVETKEKTVNESRRMMEQAADPSSTSTMISQTQKNIEEKQIELEQLKQLQQLRGEIKANLAGVITNISIKSGGVTTNEAPLLLADIGAGLRLNLQFQKEDQKYIVLGTEVSISKLVEKTEKVTTKIPKQKIVSITDNEEEPTMLNVIVDIPSEGIDIGETLRAEINGSSKKYEHCIPIEALHLSEGNSYYVYFINTKNTVMGTETIIEKNEVEIVDKNSQYAAVTGIESGKKVVVAADKEIGEGTKVRVDE